MKTCPKCNTENEDYIEVCKQCKTELPNDLPRGAFLLHSSPGTNVSGPPMNIPLAALGTKELDEKAEKYSIRDWIGQILVVVILIVTAIFFIWLIRNF